MDNKKYAFEARPETPIEETEEDLCRALWLAVAIQAIIDASSKSRKKSAIKERSQALQWLADNADEESDLALVCDLAGIDFKMLRRKFKQMLRNPSDSIDFRCLKKAGMEKRGTESRKRYFARVRKNARLKQERNLKQNGQDAKILVISPFCELEAARQEELKCAL
jgi:hypothetical protein